MPDPTSSPPSPAPATRGAALDLALAAVDVLAARGEEIEDEWTYVTALAETGRRRIRVAAGSDPSAPLDSVIGLAVVAACAEAGRIVDPHRAIDWLSTFPAVVELGLGGPPARASRAPSDAPGRAPARS